MAAETAVIAATADRHTVVHRPEDRTAAAAIPRRHRIARAPLEEALAAAPDRMEAPVVPTEAARMEARVLTEAIAEAEPVQSLPNAA